MASFPPISSTTRLRDRTVDADQPDDVAIVADDRVGIVGVAVGRRRYVSVAVDRRIADAIARDFGSLERWRAAQRLALGITREETLPELTEEKIKEIKGKHKASA